MFDPDRHHRRSIRLREFDYAQAGAYFVTICVHDHACLFGEIVVGEMRLSDIGEIAAACWAEIPTHFPHVELDAFVVMPNHLHGIIVIGDNPRQTSVGAQHAAPLPMQPQSDTFARVTPGSLGAIVRSFKSAVTKRINALRGSSGETLWQRSYHDHVIRDDADLNRIRQYIENNPLAWETDQENPNTAARSTAPA